MLKLNQRIYYIVLYFQDASLVFVPMGLSNTLEKILGKIKII